MIYFYLLPVYIAVNVYFFHEIYKWIDAIAKTINNEHKKKEIKRIKVVFTVLYSLCALSLLFAFFISDKLASKSVFFYSLRRLLMQIGNYHEGVLIYLCMGLVILLLFRLIRFILRKINKKEKETFVSERRMISGIIGFIAIILITTLGVVKAQKLYVTNYEVTVDKSVENMTDLRIVMVADLHLGYNIGVKQIEKMVSMINAEEPDLVVVAGDIFDNEYMALDDPERLIEILGSIKSKYGVYACYGNHDIEETILGGFTFGGKKNKQSSPEMDAFLEKSNIKLLMDDFVCIDESIYIYGRPDYSKLGKGIEKRLNAKELMEKMDGSKPVIVIDHEPRELLELSEAGVDIDLCGHTHDGQFFPMNLTSRYLTWENSAGLLKKGNMTNIVTSGVGLYGPNIRVGTKAEICVIDVNFK